MLAGLLRLRAAANGGKAREMLVVDEYLGRHWR